MTAHDIARTLDARPAGEGKWIAKCPAHEDKTPSLSIATGDDGRTLLHCWAGCETANVLSAAGLDWSDLFPPGERYAARQMARVLHDSPERHSDPGRRAESTLCDYADREGRKIRDEILLRNKTITHAERILDRDRSNEAAWSMLERAYQGLAELEWLADLLDSRNSRDWLTAKRHLEEINNEITAA